MNPVPVIKLLRNLFSRELFRFAGLCGFGFSISARLLLCRCVVVTSLSQRLMPQPIRTPPRTVDLIPFTIDAWSGLSLSDSDCPGNSCHWRYWLTFYFQFELFIHSHLSSEYVDIQVRNNLEWEAQTQHLSYIQVLRDLRVVVVKKMIHLSDEEQAPSKIYSTSIWDLRKNILLQKMIYYK